jgi:TatD DNase family protein
LNLTDTHCHLNLEKFDADRADVIQRATAAGVTRILIPSLDLVTSLEAVLLAKSHPALFAGIGIHPTNAALWDDETIPALEALLSPAHAETEVEGKVAAVGEIGLDYYWDAAPHELQKSVLKRQLDFAAGMEKPVVIHMREQDDAEHGPCAEDLMKILEEWVSELQNQGSALASQPGVLHSFSGSEETARQAIQLGFFIGVTGPITYKNAEARRRLIAALPLDRILIETDAPYLTPEPKRGQRNEPSFVRYITDKIGEITSKTPEEVAAVTSANAARLFTWED